MSLVRLLSDRGRRQEAFSAAPGQQPRRFRPDETDAATEHRTRGPGEAGTPPARPPVPGELPGSARHPRHRVHQGTDRTVCGRMFLAPVPGPRDDPEGEPAVVDRQASGDRRKGPPEGLGTRGCRLVACPRLGTRGPGPGRETGRETVADTNGTVTVPRPSPGRSVTSLDSAVPRKTR